MTAIETESVEVTACFFSEVSDHPTSAVNFSNVGSTIAPSYGDYQGKIVLDFNPPHKLMLLAIWGEDHNNPDRETGLENDMLYYGNQDIYKRTSVVSWRALWRSGYLNTSIFHTSSKFNEDFFDTSTGNRLIKNRSCEQQVKFRNVNHFRLYTMNSIEFGIEAKYLHHQYDFLECICPQKYRQLFLE